MPKSQQASAHPLPLSSIIWFLTVVMKHDYVRGTNYLGPYQADPVEGSIHNYYSHG